MFWAPVFGSCLPSLASSKFTDFGLSTVYGPALLPASLMASWMPLMTGSAPASSLPCCGSSMPMYTVRPAPPDDPGAVEHAPSAMTALAANTLSVLSFIQTPPQNRSPGARVDPRSLRLPPLPNRRRSPTPVAPPDSPTVPRLGVESSEEVRDGGARERQIRAGSERRAGGRRSDDV